MVSTTHQWLSAAGRQFVAVLCSQNEVIQLVPIIYTSLIYSGKKIRQDLLIDIIFKGPGGCTTSGKSQIKWDLSTDTEPPSAPESQAAFQKSV